MIKSGEDPRELLRGGRMMKELFGRLAKRILDAELANHLGYEKNEPCVGSNARNGSSRKTVLTEAGKVELDIPRDRDGGFDPARPGWRLRARAGGETPAAPGGLR